VDVWSHHIGLMFMVIIHSAVNECLNHGVLVNGILLISHRALPAPHPITTQCHEHPQLAWHSMSMCVSYSNMRWYAARIGESSVIQVQALQAPAPPLDLTSNICQPASCQICCPSIDSAYVNTSELVDKHGLSLGQMKNNKQIYLSRRILTTQRWCCNLNLAATAGLDLASTTKN
jgi:hypothetical protein